MSDQLRRRLRSTPAPRRVGEPNVLSNQAIPNRLSTIAGAGRPANPTMGPTATPSRPRSTASTTARQSPGAPALPRPSVADGDSETRRRALTLPSLRSLLFIGFLVLAAARFFNGVGSGEVDPTTAPRTSAGPQATLGALPTVDSSPGKVVFGESITNDGCKLTRSGTLFVTGIDIWWQAETTRVVGADESVVYIAMRDGVEFEHETIPPDPDVGAWSILCAGQPVAGSWPGLYRVEIRDEAEGELLSSGEYTKFNPRATIEPSAPGATPDPATVGTVSFGTSLGDDCELAGRADAFPRGVDVWWRADLRTTRVATADALVATLHDGRQVGLEYFAADAARGTWSVLCADEPSVGVSVGTFVVEVWDGRRSILLAVGTFERKP